MRLLPNPRGLAGDCQTSEDTVLLSLRDHNRHIPRPPNEGVCFRFNRTAEHRSHSCPVGHSAQALE